MFLAKTTIFIQGQFFFHSLFIACRAMRDAFTHRTFEFYHRIFDLSHNFTLSLFTKPFHCTVKSTIRQSSYAKASDG